MKEDLCRFLLSAEIVKHFITKTAFYHNSQNRRRLHSFFRQIIIATTVIEIMISTKSECLIFF